MNILKLLKKSRFFHNFEDKEINSIFDSIRARIVKYSRGIVIAKQGSDVTEIGVVLTGTLLKYVTKKNGNNEAQGAMVAGEMFGDVDAFLPNKKLSYSVVSAEEEVDVLYLSAETITLFADENSPYHKKLLDNVIGSLAEKIAKLSGDTEYLVIKSMRLKIAKLIYEKHLEQNGALEVVMGINRNEMADYLNVSRPSMSREMMRMRDEGIIDFKKDNVTIKKLSEVKKIVVTE
ncbi:MAG: Crp/Fnr family transcriptional regulator [Firmicutes bacterium]|nr:Crp/Fnr family transcriptional regulator [Bacillota bacterium]